MNFLTTKEKSAPTPVATKVFQAVFSMITREQLEYQRVYEKEVSEREEDFDDECSCMECQSGIETSPEVEHTTEIIAKDPSVTTSTDELVSSCNFDDTLSVMPLQLSHVLDREYLHPVPIVWSVGQSYTALLASYNLPYDFMQLNGIATAGLFNYHALFKSDFEITLRTDATNYNQGIVVAFAVPGEETLYDTFENLNYSTVLNYPHVFLNVGLDEAVKLQVPYGHRYNFVPPMSRRNVASRVYIMVWSPLGAGTSAPTTLNISTWMKPINHTLAVKTTYVLAQTLQSVVKPVAHAILDNFDVPFKSQLKGLGKVFGLYDRVLVDNQKNESFRCADAPVSAVNTKFDQLEVIPNMQHRYSTQSFLDFLDFAKIPSLAAIKSWSTSDSVGSILIDYEMSPTSPILTTFNSGSYQWTNPTNLAGIASLFRFYRGGINVRLQLVATSFHRGSLFVAFDPYGVGGATVTQIYGLPGISMAVGSNSNDLSFKLPYTKHKDYLNINWSGNIPLDDILGRLYVVVQNSLTAPVNVSTTIQLLLYVSAADDAEFSFPLAYDRRVAKQAQTTSDGMIYQSLYEKDDLKKGFIIGKHTSLLNYMRRPEYTFRNTTTMTGNNVISVVGYRCDDTGLRAIVNNLHKYSTGGVIVHVISNIPRTVGAVSYFYYNYNDVSVHNRIGNSLEQGSYGNVWPGAMHNMTIEPAYNLVVPGYADTPFFYNCGYNKRAGKLQDMGWSHVCETSRSSSGGSLTASTTFGLSAADDWMPYFPMSMFRVAVPISAEIEGGLLGLSSPKFQPSITGFAGSPLNIVDGSLTQFISNSATSCTINVDFAVNAFDMTKFFMNYTCSDPNDTVVLTAVASDGTVTRILSAALDGTWGYLDFEMKGWFQRYILTFSLSNQDNLRVFELQYYASAKEPIMPTMLSAVLPTGWKVTSNGDFTDNGSACWKIFPEGKWEYLSTTNPQLNMFTPSSYVVTAFDFTVVGSVGQAVTPRLYGSNTTSGWQLIFTAPTFTPTATSIPYKYYTFPNTQSFTNYRYSPLVGGAQMYYATFQLYGTPSSVPTNAPFAPVLPTVFESQSVVQLKRKRLRSHFDCKCLTDVDDVIVPKKLSEQEAEDKETRPTIVEAQGLMSFVADGFAKGYQNVMTWISTTTSSVKELVGLSRAKGGMKQQLQGLLTALGGLRNLCEILCRLISDLNNILHANEFIAAASFAGLTMTLMRLIPSTQQQEDVIEAQSEHDSWWSRILEYIKTKNSEIAAKLSNALSPRHITAFFGRLGEKIGITTSLIRQIYHDERDANPDGLSIVAALTACFKSLIYGERYQEEYDLAYSRELADRTSEVKTILTEYKYGRKGLYQQEMSTYENLLPLMDLDIVNFRRRQARVKLRKEVNITTFEKYVDELRDRLKRSSLTTAGFEPVSYMLSGDPGVGKSELAGKLIPAVLNRLLKDDPNYVERYIDFSELDFSKEYLKLCHTFSVTEHNKFDSLYNKQPFLLIDDAFTGRDAVDSETIVRVVNSCRMEVSKAHVSDKGTVYDSPFVAITTNETNPIPLANTFIHGASKLIRRFGKIWHVALKRDVGRFTMRDLSPRGFDDDDKYFQSIMDKLDSTFDFQVVTLDKDGGLPNFGKKETFSQVIHWLISEFKRKSSYYDGSLAFVAGKKIPVMKAQGDTSEANSEFTEDEWAESVILDVEAVRAPALQPILDKSSKKITPLSLFERYTLPVPQWEDLALVSVEDGISEGSHEWIEARDNFHENENLIKYISLILFSTVDGKFRNRDVKKYYVDMFNTHLHWPRESLGNQIKKERWLKYCLSVWGQKLYNEIIPPVVKSTISEKVRSVWFGLTSFAERVRKYVPDGIAFVVVTAGMTAVITLFYKMCASFTNAMKSLVPQSFSGYDNKAVVQKSVHLPSNIIPQSEYLSQNDQELVEKIRRNVVKIQWEGGVVKQHATFINSRKILINKHFFFREREFLAEGRRIIIEIPSMLGKAHTWEVLAIPPDQRISYNDDSDTYLCVLSRAWPNIRDISKHLYDGSSVKNKNAVLLSADKGKDIGVIWNGTPIDSIMRSDEENIPGKKRLYQVDFTKRSGQMDVTIKGDCGRPYFVVGHGVCGIHAGMSETSIFGGASVVPIIKHPLEPEVAYVVEATETQNNYWRSATPLYNNVVVDGVPVHKYISRNTEFVRIKPPLVMDSECDFEPTAKLPMKVETDNGVMCVDPLVTNAQKWDVDKKSGVPLRYINLFATYYSAKMGEVRCEPPRVLSADETINGYDQMGQIKMSTSSGIWSEYFGEGKRKLFEPLEQEVIDGIVQPVKYVFSEEACARILEPYGKSFLTILQEKDKMIRDGLIPFFPYISTLKDELRQKSKVKIGKTRVFEQSSLDFTLLCRKYFGHFVNAFRKNAGFTLYHGIGRDKDAVWPKYATELQSFSPYGHCFDYKNFDGSLPAECFEFFKQVTDRYYATNECVEEINARHSLIDAMQNGVHVMNDLVFETTHGNKSGNAFTDVFNSISNTFLMWMAFVCHQDRMSVVNGVGGINIAEFDQQIRMLTYGDDVVMAIKPNLLADGFDGEFIESVMLELGVTITSADKRERIESYIPIDQVTFLKSPFVKDAEYNIWKAPLPIDAILRELKFRPKGCRVDPKDLTQRTLNVMQFLAHHDRQVFDKWKAILLERTTDCSAKMALQQASYDYYCSLIRLKQEDERSLF